MQFYVVVLCDMKGNLSSHLCYWMDMDGEL